MFKNTRYGLAILGLLVPLITQAEGTAINSAVDGTQYSNSKKPEISLPLANASILGASAVANAGITVVQGNVAVFPGTSIIGFPPGVIVNGALHSADTFASTAHTAAQNYYNSLIAMNCPPANNLTGKDLGGMTLKPGVYCFTAEATLNGVLILQGNGLYTFQIGSALTTGPSSKVVLTGGAMDTNVNWAVGSSATLGVGSTFQGIVDAVASITVGAGASLVGRAWALNGAITLNNNAINFYDPAIPKIDTEAKS